MLIQKPLPLWIGVSLFVGAIVTIPLISQSRHRPVAWPGTLMELTELLSHDAPELYVAAVREDCKEEGIYICTQPQPREQLRWLQRNSLGAVRWQGIVHCARIRRGGFVIEEHELQSWGEHGMRIGSLLFFGDPTLLRRIREATLDGEAAENNFEIFSD
jgi:hypothetical protein